MDQIKDGCWSDISISSFELNEQESHVIPLLNMGNFEGNFLMKTQSWGYNYINFIIYIWMGQ